jgi:catechol 2,3-dioxygenase-like lactoylglutathione lyase family enzyme
MIPFSAVSHISVTVTDLEKARAFYGGTLGLAEIPRPAFRFPGVWYALEGERLSLHVTVKDAMPLVPAAPDRFDTRDPHFALAVPDADETCARLRASGLAFYDFEGTPTGLRQLFVRDPDGNMIELVGPTREARVRRMEGEA